MLVLLSVAGGAAAVGLAVAVMAWRRGWLGAPVLLSVVGLALAGGALLVFLDQSRREPRRAEGGALAQRADLLAGRSLAPNSPLACLDAPAGLTVAAACEAVVFGRPETIAAAVAYVAAKLALLSETAALGGRAVDGTALAALRRSIEADRFGIAAHVLAAEHECNAEHCAAFAWVADSVRLRSNLKEATFDRIVARHAPAWPAAGENRPVMAETAPPASATGPAGAASPSAAAVPPSPAGKPMSPRFDFPSAASIPPVSIMVPEREPREGSSASPAGAEGRGGGGSAAPLPPRRPPAPRAVQGPASAPAAAAPARPASPAPDDAPEPAGGN
jgi:hypothetical protein